MSGVLDVKSGHPPRNRMVAVSRRLHERAGIVVATLLATAGVWLAHAWGPGQDGFFDSAFYLDGARHLADGDGFVSAVTDAKSRELAPVIRWAPGFPVLTALVGRALRLSALDAASFVLAAAYVSLILAAFSLGRLLFGPRHVVLAAVCAVLVGIQSELLAALDALLSDLPFGALAIINTAVAVTLARREAWSPIWVVAFATTLCAMFFVRYAGALYIPGLLIATSITMLARGRGLRVVLWNHLRVALLSAFAIGAWIARNKQFGEKPFGARVVADGDWHLHADRALHGSLAWWYTLRDLAATENLERYFMWGTFAVAAAFGLLLLTRNARLWEGLCFTLLPSLAYWVLMVESATRVKFDPIQHPRFWVPVWSLSFVAAACCVAHVRRLWQHLLAFIVIAGLLGIGLGEAVLLRRSLPGAQQARGLLVARWRAAAEVLPSPGSCRLFVTDVRPLMLHRRLGPSSEIPLSLGELNDAARFHERICLAVLSPRLRVSTTAERRRVEQNKVIAALKKAGRLKQLSGRSRVTVYQLRSDSALP